MIHTCRYHMVVFHEVLSTSSVHTPIVWFRMKILLSLFLSLLLLFFPPPKASERPSAGADLFVTCLVLCSCDGSPVTKVRAQRKLWVHSWLSTLRPLNLSVSLVRTPHKYNLFWSGVAVFVEFLY